MKLLGVGALPGSALRRALEIAWPLDPASATLMYWLPKWADRK